MKILFALIIPFVVLKARAMDLKDEGSENQKHLTYKAPLKAPPQEQTLPEGDAPKCLKISQDSQTVSFQFMDKIYNSAQINSLTDKIKESPQSLHFIQIAYQYNPTKGKACRKMWEEKIKMVEVIEKQNCTNHHRSLKPSLIQYSSSYPLSDYLEKIISCIKFGKRGGDWYLRAFEKQEAFSSRTLYLYIGRSDVLPVRKFFENYTGLILGWNPY